jgi:Leucine-rich repeat (LRR) protein
MKHFGWFERLKHVETIASIPNLETLGIVGQRLTDLSFLAPLRRLRSISFRIGGTRNFADLPGFPALEEVSVWRTPKLEIEHLLPVNQIARLKRLVLSELPRITTLDWLTNPFLRLLDLDRLRGLHSYASLEGLPGLETLVLRGKFTADNIAELSRLPNLKTLYVHEYPLKRLRPAVQSEALPFAIRIIDFVQGEFPD